MELAPIPPSLAVIAGAVILTIIFKLIGKKVASDKHPALDRIVDVATVLSAATAVTGLITTPLVSSFADLAKKLIDDVLARNIAPILSLGVNIVATIVTIILLGVYFKKYEKTETLPDLIILGLVMLAAGTAFPWVNTALHFWVEYPLTVVWNIVVSAYNTITGIRFSV